MNQRDDIFMVGPLIDNMTVFNMVAYYPDVQFNYRFISVGVNVNGYLQFPADQLSKSVVGLDHYPIMYFTATRMEPSITNNGSRISYYQFKVFEYKEANSMIGYLGLVNGTVLIVDDPQTITVTTTDPSTFNNDDILLTGVRYSIGSVPISPCNSVYDLDDTPDRVIIEVVNDVFDTDIDQDIFTSPDSPATTSWCNGVGPTAYISEPSIVFLPVSWYNQGSCSLSLMSRSILDSNFTINYGGRQYPPSVYMLQCMTQNGDAYNDSSLCRSIRELVSYTDQSTCLQYSDVGKFFYGDICGENNPNYPGIFDTTMNAYQVVGPCNCDSNDGNCLTSCIYSYNRIQCISPTLPTRPDMSDIPDNTSDQPTLRRGEWVFAALIGLAIIFVVLILVVILIARRR